MRHKSIYNTVRHGLQEGDEQLTINNKIQPESKNQRLFYAVAGAKRYRQYLAINREELLDYVIEKRV